MTKAEQPLQLINITYNDWVVRWFIWASVFWGLVGFLVGAIIATQLAWWPANLGEYLSFGRLRPLHTNAVIFAFVGNMMFAGVYHSTQRLVKARIQHDVLAKAHFWGWQLIIVAAALSLPLGFTQGKEYAELEWPIDIAIAVVWVIFAINFFWMLWKRTEKHLYVAIWFYIASIATVAVLHIVNSMAIPVLAMKSYSIFGGAQDALVQWWYGHNAVAFFLTTPILGIMYYYLPKAARRPVYSYRLSVVHFWALVFLYIWAGPHHLLNTALPEWAQTLGMVFSLMLWAPSWGGMLNGLLTLRGAWDRVRTDPVLKFLAAAVTFYGMSTFEGPMLSIRSVSGLAHYTDWIIGHVHSGALGWNGFMAAGLFYFLVPRLYGTKLFSRKLADQHFYLGTVGILLYMISMWVSGITQGMMWRARQPDGSLMYDFVATVQSIEGMYWMRLIGGTMYLIGMCMMAYNLVKTAKSGAPVETQVEVAVPLPDPDEVAWPKLVFGRPVILTVVVLAVFTLFATANKVSAVAFLVIAVCVLGVALVMLTKGGEKGKPGWQRLVEGRALAFTIVTVMAVLVGGVAEIVPALVTQPAQPNATAPYSALELEGRDVYIREGCYNCHSQMIRPFDFEVQRYGGTASKLEDSQHDHPFQWGSKRTGPDLAHEGQTNPETVWHYKHFMDPRSMSDGSLMPAYEHFATNTIDYSSTHSKLAAMRTIGVPYSAAEVEGAEADAKVQAQVIVDRLAQEKIAVAWNSEMVAIISYMQRLGVDRAPAPAATGAPQPVSLRTEGGQ